MSAPTLMARPALPSAKNPFPSVQGDIDTTYHTQQRDMFASGLAAEIGVNAFAVWPRWPPQTAPLMAGQTAPGRTGWIMTIPG